MSSHPPYSPVTPVDATNGFRLKPSKGVGFADGVSEKEYNISTRSVRSNSDSSQDSNQVRRARFAEATSVISPAAGPGEKQGPFADPPNMASATTPSRPSDFGFGYISDSNPVEQHATIPAGYGANGQPLKSAMKTPGTAARLINPLSPTFREETMLEREEEKTEKEQAKDLKVKTRVRMAKMVLRGVNFSCSLIVLALLSTTLTIFHATKALPSRNNTPAWAVGTSTWPQLVVLSIACVSLLFSIIIIGAYCCGGGHRRAEKVAVYYTMFAVGYFIFSIIMWVVGAAVLQGTKANGNGMDLWGWACKDNKRRQLFEQDVQYALICRLQDWSLICCIIEIIVEIFVVAIYAVVFYRFYSKHKLRKSMDARDRARSDLYLAQLRSQSAPNTPGYTMTPRNPYFPSVNEQKKDPYVTAEEGGSTSANHYATTSPTSAQTSSPFKLQAPPVRATPRAAQDGFESPQQQQTRSPSAQSTHQERVNEHVNAAPGETVYESVPIPGAYAGQSYNPYAQQPTSGGAHGHGY